MIILATVNTGADVQVTADLMSDLKITDRAIAGAFDRLITAGYLERRGGRGAPGRGMIGVTRRGRTAYGTIMFTTLVERWTDLPLRQGDIIVSCVPKSGTTWVQMICALLIFQTPDLPAPLKELSIWPEWELAVRDDVLARLAAQQHRRFMKSHEPLSTIPADPRVTHIVVARHPLDAALSFYRQRDFNDKREQGHVGRPPAGEAPSPRQALLHWMDMESHPPGAAPHSSLPGVLGHVRAAWERRDEPNVVLVRYEDLSADLEGQMRGLAVRLGITVPEETWPPLVKAATFEQMRKAADRIQPIFGLTDPKLFFRTGRPGSGQELLTGTELAHYHERAARLAPPDMLAWLHAPGEPAR
ncbi:MAG TPA: sulfotransferase domain-containing protein [Streptosporangiaceae bacterium]